MSIFKAGDKVRCIRGSHNGADGSGYMAALCVKTEFGCNQWSQANPQGKQE